MSRTMVLIGLDVDVLRQIDDIARRRFDGNRAMCMRYLNRLGLMAEAELSRGQAELEREIVARMARNGARHAAAGVQ